METSNLVLLVAAACAFVCAACAAAACANFVAEGARAARVAQAAGGLSLARRALAHGVPALTPLARRLIDRTRMGVWAAGAVELLAYRGIAASRESACSLLVAFALAVGAAGALAFTPVAGAALSAAAALAVAGGVSRRVRQQRERVRDALPDALRTMEACFHAGLSQAQTFQQLAREARRPLSDVFDRAARGFEAGEPLPAVLARMRADSGVSELSFLSAALEIQHQAGGSMGPVIGAARDSLEGELDLKRSLRVHTAQARLSARVVVGVTFLLLAALSALSEDFLGPFFASPAGMALFGMAVSMQVAGIVAVRRLLDVEVD